MNQIKQLVRARKEVVLVTGALGQVGRDLIPTLKETFGEDSIITTDVRELHRSEMREDDLYIQLDVCDRNAVRDIVRTFNVNRIVHLATVLSAVGEQYPMKAHEVNVTGTLNILEVARELKQTLKSSRTRIVREQQVSVFSPSTIAVFGPTTPKVETPDDTVCLPTTMYGISKVHMECLGNYYQEKYNIDFRSLRYPGIVSCGEPGGGTTDFIIDMYQSAAKYKTCTSFIDKDTALPFMHMNDCLKATEELMLAKKEDLSRRVYNVTGISCSPRQVFESIKKFVPDCQVQYAPDYRDGIASSWPSSIDDSFARRDWKWNHAYDLDAMTEDMLKRFREKDDDA